MMDSEQEYFELSNSEDGESEQENEKKEKEDKNRIITFEFNSIKTLHSLILFCCENFISLHHPDISTPPPKLYSIFT